MGSMGHLVHKTSTNGDRPLVENSLPTGSVKQAQMETGL